MLPRDAFQSCDPLREGERRVLRASRPVTELVACTDAHFGWLLGGRSPTPEFGLAPGGLEKPPILEMLRDLAAQVSKVHRTAAWLIVAGSEVVGLCSITKAANDEGCVEIGYGIAASRRGRGHATRAVAAMMPELLRDPQVHGIVAGTAIANKPSQRVLEENQFIRTGMQTDEEDGETIRWRYARP